MEGLALVLSCLAIIVQFYGILSENDCIGKEIKKNQRIKRSHENDQVLNSTNNKIQGKTSSGKSKIDVSDKWRERIPPRGKPKNANDGPKQTDSKIVNIKLADNMISPRNLQHFIADIDEESPVPHIQVKEPRFKNEHFKAAFKNKTLEGNKSLKKDKIENIPKKLLLENITQSAAELIPQFQIADNEHDKKHAIKFSSDSNKQSKLINTTKEEAKDKLFPSFRKSPENVLNSKKQGPDNDSIIEIKEHKYEEEIVRCHPTKSCQPNIKRNWEASQNFNSQFSNSPHIQAMNPYQGYTPADQYQRVNTYNKDKYYSAYTCENYMDQSNGKYFYANFDIEPYNQAKENQRFQGCSNYDRIKKTWLDRNTKIRTASKPDEYIETNMNDYNNIISNE